MAAERFTFYLSFLEQINKMPPEAQLSAYRAICEYALLGKEPDFSNETTAYADIVFTGIRPILDSGKRKTESGRKGGAGERKRNAENNAENNAESALNKEANRKQTVSKPKAKRKQTESKTEANTKLLEEEVEEEVEEEGNIYDHRGAAITDADLEREFEELWERYPRKEGKKAAKAAYIAARKRKKDPVTKAQVEIGISNYRGCIKADGRPEEYIMHGSTFFRGERWNDDFKAWHARDGNKWAAGMETHQYDFDELERDLLQEDRHGDGATQVEQN